MSKKPIPFTDKIILAQHGNSKYNQRSVMSKLRAYLRECIDARQTPFVEQFALKIGVSERTLQNWTKDEDKKDFAEWYEIMKTIQKLDIKKKALTGEYISKIAALVLSAEHDVVERVKREVGGMDGKPIEVEQKLSPEDRKAYSDQITQIFEKIYSKPNEQ